MGSYSIFIVSILFMLYIILVALFIRKCRIPLPDVGCVERLRSSKGWDRWNGTYGIYVREESNEVN